MIRRLALLIALLVLLLIGAGCLTTPWGENKVTSSERYDLASESYSGQASPFSGSGSSSYPVPAMTPAPGYTGDAGTDPKIIKTSYLTIEVRNVTASLDPLRSIATAHGGYVGSLSVNTRYGDHLYAVLTMRVPAYQFDSTITEIKKLGSLKSESLSADDVTEEYVDLQARRTALASQLAQYTRIMERAENVSEILEVQVQIERVQVELDRIDGRLKYLDNRVDYATITVSLQEPEPVGGREGFSFVSVINESIAGFLAVTAGLIIILVSIIPLIILGAVAYVLYRLWKGRRGGKQKIPGEKEKENEGKPPGQ
ncbi:hypothetical protein ASZ90_015110 [hydrocarbon metagenome]|uniref:DUF4349 domain-containing protein n=1 Tax=hydrocarbon metagenome TaxID=938273 RepID=A0A0W8F3T0_9ZZZZ